MVDWKSFAEITKDAGKENIRLLLAVHHSFQFQWLSIGSYMCYWVYICKLHAVLAMVTVLNCRKLGMVYLS